MRFLGNHHTAPQTLTLGLILLLGGFWVVWMGFSLVTIPDADFKWLLLFGLTILAYAVYAFGSAKRYFNRRNSQAEKRHAKLARTTEVTELPAE